MGDLERRPSRLGGGDDLPDRLQEAVALAPHVGREDPALAPRHGREGRQFLRWREAGRRIDQSRGQAQGSLVHAALQGRDHGLQLLRRGGAIGASQGGPAEGVVADQQAEVDRDPLIQEPAEVTPHVVPGVVQTVDLAIRLGAILPPGPPDGGGRIAAVPPDLARHPLEHGALGRPREEEVVIGVAVDVHEARGRRQVSGVDHPSRPRRGQVASHGDDPVAGDGDIGSRRGTAAPVKDLRPADQDVQRHVRVPCMALRLQTAPEDDREFSGSDDLMPESQRVRTRGPRHPLPRHESSPRLVIGHWALVIAQGLGIIRTWPMFSLRFRPMMSRLAS